MSTKLITKEECERKIKELGRVCDRCGRELVAIETVDNAGSPTYWSGCYHGSTGNELWGHYTSGVSVETFIIAEKMVCNGYVHYRGDKVREDNDTPEVRLNWFQTQVSGVCGLLNEIDYLKEHEPRMTKDEFLLQKYF